MEKSYDGAMTFAQRWIDIIHKSAVTEEEAKAIIEESTYNFAEHFNRGWLDYRKSVTEAGDWACVEWTGYRSNFQGCIRKRIYRLPWWLWDDGPWVESS